MCYLEIQGSTKSQRYGPLLNESLVSPSSQQDRFPQGLNDACATYRYMQAIYPKYKVVASQVKKYLQLKYPRSTLSGEFYDFAIAAHKRVMTILWTWYPEVSARTVKPQPALWASPSNYTRWNVNLTDPRSYTAAVKPRDYESD